MVEWLFAHYLDLFLASYVLDKIAKATPWKVDDFIVDTIFGSIKKVFALKQRRKK